VSAYILRRVLSMMPVLLIVSIIAFGLLYVLPGDPAVAILGDNAGNQQTYLALRHDLGLDQPLHAQYLSWLGRVVQGDLGRSIRTNESVATVLLQRVPISMYLGAAGLLVGLALGLSVAIVSALRPGSRIDSLGTLLAMGGVAIPSFWQALLLVYVFAVLLRWVPPSGFTSPWVDPLLSVKMLVLPAIVLGTHSAAVIMRQGRSALMEVLEQDYITTARAKGLSGAVVVLKHALRNALIPVATVVGLQFGALLGGAVVVETVFARPGLGLMLVNGIKDKDFPVVQAGMLVAAAAYVLANLLVDLSYGWLDPRIRLDRKSA